MVYNNFVWPQPDDGQRQQIEECAQAVLGTGELYPDVSLATLYDPDKNSKTNLHSRQELIDYLKQYTH